MKNPFSGSIAILSMALLTTFTYSQSREWSIVASYTVPGKASGLAWDGTYLYFGIYGSNGDHVYQFDPVTGTPSLLFVNPSINDSYGMTFDGTNLWITDHGTSPSQPALAVELDFSGNIISTITLPDHYMSGIAYDDGDFWVCTYYPDPGTVYKINSSGGVITQFIPPDEQPWDICTEGDDLWIADYWGDMLYKVNQSGTLLEQHPSESTDPSGIVYDGTYLWYVDGPTGSNSTLYKVDLGGAGTPVINIPNDSHDYGIVTIGESETWNLAVQNTGNANLSVTGILIPPTQPVSTTFTPPAVIQPGGQIFIPLIYSPTVTGPLNTSVTIQSSDPIHPQESVRLTGNAVNPGPSLQVPATSHNWGLVRKNAFKRWFLEVQNIGDQVLSVTGINSSEEVFVVDQDQEFPIDLDPLEIVNIAIWFNPQGGGMYGGTLDIVNNDPAANPFTVSLNGEGQDRRWVMGDALWYYYIEENYDNSPKAILPIRDITGDGIYDVVVCSEDNYIRCFNGNSSGVADLMWETEVYSGNVMYQRQVTPMPDIDADGYEDLVVGTTGGDRSVIALSGKTGDVIWKFFTSQYTGTGGWVYQVDASYDYNDDGFSDVLAATGYNQGSGPGRIICIDGMTKDEIWNYNTGGPNYSVIGVSDFTGDGFPDVVAGVSNSDETQGYVYGLDGTDGSFVWAYPVDGTSVWALEQLDDINGDGTQDVIAGDFDSRYYYLDAESGTELHSGNVGYGNIILSWTKVNDVDNDGYPDFVPGYSGNNALLMSGLDGSTVWFTPIADNSWNVANIADVSGDGLDDVIIGTLYTSNYCYFMDGSNGDELKAINYNEPVDALNSIPDIVGDGSMEMVAGGRYGKVYCYSGGINTGVGILEGPLENGLAASIYPNPVIVTSQNTLSIQYELEEPGQTKILIVNGVGKVIDVPLDIYQAQGRHLVTKDLSDFSSGIYIVRIESGNDVVSLKLTVL